MSSKPNLWMPLYIGDYLRDTQRLTAEQHGAYLLLIMDYWMNGPLPDNDVVLAQVARLSPDAWSNARSILQAFFEHSDGHWYHKRIDQERAQAFENIEARKTKAKAAAEARWGRREDAPSNATGNAASNARSNARSNAPSPSPVERERGTRAREESTGLPTSIDPEFEPKMTPRMKKLVEHWPEGMFDNELFAFIAHAQANGRMQIDWQAAFCMWVKKTNDRIRENYGTGIPASSQQRAKYRNDHRKSGFAQALDDNIERLERGGDGAGVESLPAFNQ